jgi:hypothetical protein
MKFKDWMILAEGIDPQQIINAAMVARKSVGVCDRAHFGDCKEISEHTVEVLKRAGIECRLSGGTFTTNLKDNSSWDHSWVVVANRWILDATIDQFFKDLDVDMKTKSPGIYYSHPSWDGNVYKDRYFRFKSKVKLDLGNGITQK